MAKITPRATMQVTITLDLDEAEARAIDALSEYGTDAFLKVFYNHLGRNYLAPHEGGLRSFFATANAAIPASLRRIDKAREAWSAEGQAAEKAKP